MAEGKRSENRVIWHPNQTDIISNNSLISRPQTDGSWLSSPHTCVTQHLFQDTVDDSKSVSTWAALPSYSTPHSSKLENESFLDPVEKVKKADTATSYRLFGIELINHPASSPTVEKANAQPISVSNGSTERHISTLPATDSDHKSDLSKDSKDTQAGQMQVPPKEIQSRQNCFASTRSRTKVQMQGVAVGRAVDLTILRGYDELTDELEEMFDIKGQLHPRDKWEIVYTDDEGDMMLVGDYPWQEFCNMVRRIFICSSQDVKKLSSGSKLPGSSTDGEGTVISSDSTEN